MKYLKDRMLLKVLKNFFKKIAKILQKNKKIWWLKNSPYICSPFEKNG